VLLCRRADTVHWSPPGGIIEPGEHPADAAARECFEETGVIARPETLTSVSVSDQLVCPNGDQVQYLELVFRCRPVQGVAQVNDDESIEVGWHPLDALPGLNAGVLGMLTPALQGRAAAAYSFAGVGAGVGAVVGLDQ